jgi:hypothetical protein
MLVEQGRPRPAMEKGLRGRSVSNVLADLKESPPPEGTAAGQGWVVNREGLLQLGPTPPASGSHPSQEGNRFSFF